MSTAAESEGTPPRNFKRLRKEFDAFKAADGLIFSDSSLRIEFVHDEECAWGASLVPPTTPGGAVCWVARVSVLTPGRPGGRRDADTAAVFVEMDDSYPFQAPRVSLAWRKTELDGCNAADTCATTPTAQRIPLTLGRHQWSPALTVAKLLAILIPRTLSLMDEAAAVGMDHHPERLQAFLSCGPACQLLWRRAASGSVDIVWLSVGSGLSECKEGGATLPSQYICEPALPEVGGAYYYQHLPARVQRAAVGGKRVLVLLVDEHGSRSSLPGFNAPERWVGESLNFSHVTLPIEVAFVHDRWPSWVQSERHSEEKQAATSTMVAVLQAAAEHAEVWVSDFRTECDRLNTAISIFSGAACRHDPRCSQALTAALSARGEGGWNQSAIAAAGNLVESTAGISYLRAADDALASGKLRGDSTLMTDAELERALDEDPRAKDPLYFGGRAHAARALRVAAWEWQVGPGTASNSTAVEVEPELQPSTTEKEEEREMNEQQHTPDDLRERRCLTYNVFGGGPHADLRLQHLVATVVAAEPDVLCLQEATPAVLAALQHTARLPHMVTKLELLESVAPLPADDHAAVCAAGFLAVLSKYPLAKARLVHRGGWLDDGILRVEVSGFGIVYNVHLVRNQLCVRVKHTPGARVDGICTCACRVGGALASPQPSWSRSAQPGSVSWGS